MIGGGGCINRRQVSIKPGQDYPRKPRVAEVFKDEDEMDDHIVHSLKKEK
jgi:hypothetical protein